MNSTRRGSGWGRSVEVVGTENLGANGTIASRTFHLPLLTRPVEIARIQLAAALVALNLCDVVLTKLILGLGGVEGNPLMKGLMEGTFAPLGVKALFSACAGVLLLLCPPESRFANRGAATVVGVYLAVVVWNASLLGWLVLNR